MNKTLIGAALLGFATVAQATIPGYGLNRLFMVSEWNQLCAGLGASERVASCKAGFHRATMNGRATTTFELINPRDQSLLQTRSGVLFRPLLNEKIVRVDEDNGMRTTVRLPDDLQCQAYAATPDLVGMPRSDRNYQHLIQSWLSVYTDEPSRIRTISVGEQEGRRVLRFEALTQNNRVVHGNYLFDARANAAIFSTCDHPAASGEGYRNSELFFGSIVGSVRRFT